MSVFFEAIHQRVHQSRKLRCSLRRDEPLFLPSGQLCEPVRQPRYPHHNIRHREQRQQEPVPRVVVKLAALDNTDPRLDAQALLRAKLGLLRGLEPRRLVTIGAGPGDRLAHRCGHGVLPADELVVAHDGVDVRRRVGVHAERVAALEPGLLVALQQAAAHAEENRDVDADDGQEDGEAPAVAKDVAQVRRVLRDPAPVARHGLDPVGHEGQGGGEEGHGPDEEADQALLGRAAVHDPPVEVDGQQGHHRDGEDGEVGGLDGNLADPAVQVTGQPELEPFLCRYDDASGDCVVERVDELCEMRSACLICDTRYAADQVLLPTSDREVHHQGISKRVLLLMAREQPHQYHRPRGNRRERAAHQSRYRNPCFVGHDGYGLFRK